jgi:photosystem II stability/assembly factor-like uncharacterized protein
MAQPLGTSDGTTVDGIRVFFVSDPVITDGSGAVTVANQDGNATFTAPNQAYHEYAERLDNGATSMPKTWAWEVTFTVNAFTFSVLVAAPIPHEQSVLRWTAQNSTVMSRLTDIWGSSAANLFAVGLNGTILHTGDGGANWSTQVGTGSEHLYGVWGRSANDVIIVGASPLPGVSDARILVTSVGGPPWTDQDAGTTRDLRAVWGVSPNVFAVGGSGASPGGRIRVSTNNGSGTWVPGADVTDWVNGVWAASAAEAWAVGNAGTIYHTTNSGADWSAQVNPRGDGYDLFAVWGVSTMELWVVGAEGTVLHTVDGGTNWQDESLATSNFLYGVWAASATDVFVVGEFGEVAHYDGASWQSMNSGTTEDLRSVFGISGTDVFAVGDGGTVLHGTR